MDSVDEKCLKPFACPFYKRRPWKYQLCQKCPGPGWPSIHRLK
jgi:hypothetical protein